MSIIIKLDYTLVTVKERLELVNKILNELEEEPNPNYLEILANYLIIPIEKEERKKRKILTENRLATVTKNETSFEGLISQLENGEDGIYNLINESKTAILHPKVTITKKDIENIPALRQLREAISIWENKLKRATGRDAYIIKKTIIELRKDQYVIKNAYYRTSSSSHISRSNFPPKLDESFILNENNYIIPSGCSLADPKICSIILCNYSRLKEDSYGHFDSDLYYLMEDFDEISNKALSEYPLYRKIVECKIDGLQNIDIQKTLKDEFNIIHSFEYISSLWRNKIPKLIASAAEDNILDWYFLHKEKGKYKRCSKCGQIKLAHNKYFSKNKTSKDGFYSICKKCRNTKTKKL